MQRATLEDKRLSADAVATTVRAAADAQVQVWPEIERDTTMAQALRANTDALVACAEGALWQGGVHRVLVRAGHSLGEAGMVSGAFTYWKQLHDTASTGLRPDHPDTKVIWPSLLH